MFSTFSFCLQISKGGTWHTFPQYFRKIQIFDGLLMVPVRVLISCQINFDNVIFTGIVFSQSVLNNTANVLKTSQRHPDRMESYINIHKSCKRALPKQIIEYKHAILLHKLYNEKQPVTDWIKLNTNQILTSRQTYFKIARSNNFKIGNNKLTTRLCILNNKIILQDLNMSLDSFKVKFKKSLLQVT